MKVAAQFPLRKQLSTGPEFHGAGRFATARAVRRGLGDQARRTTLDA
ncbi:hypothetical protein ACFPRL_17810 [Pseudoclavibacter helvolus]